MSTCVLASIATSGTQHARRGGGSMNGALPRSRGRKRPKARPGTRTGSGCGADRAAPSVDVKSRLWHDNGVALVGLTLLRMVLRPLPLFSFASPAFKTLPSFSLYLLSLFAFLLCRSGKRLQHCRGGCTAGAGEFFFNLCYCQSWPVTLDTRTHTDI